MTTSVTQSQISINNPVISNSRLKPTKKTVDTASLALILVFSLGLGAVLGLTFITVTKSELDAPGGKSMFLGNVTAMVGTYLALIMLILISRNYIMEKVLGQDQLIHWHRKIGPWPLTLIAAHVVLTTIGYAQAAKTNVFHELSTFISSFPNLLAAIIGFIFMAIAGILTIKYIRERIKRETWWTVHLLLYIAMIISFAHIIGLGPAFVGHPLATHLWALVWILVAVIIFTFRFAIPIYKNLYHNIRVHQVQIVADNVTSIICTGYNLQKLKARGGQFFYWRFLTKKMWWQAHPFSISSIPDTNSIRLTVKNLGDYTSELSNLRAGTKVYVEGPYGVFTKYRQLTRKALLISGGIGMTALRSLLEDLPTKSQPVVINRAAIKDELVLHDEILNLVKLKKGVLHEVIGSRADINFNGAMIKKLVPDLFKRDVFLSGSQEFIDYTLYLLHSLGINDDYIHYEVYSL